MSESDKDKILKSLIEEAHGSLAVAATRLADQKATLTIARRIGRVIECLTDALDLLLCPPTYPTAERAAQIEETLSLSGQRLEDWTSWYMVLLTEQERTQIERCWVLLPTLAGWPAGFQFWMQRRHPPVPEAPKAVASAGRDYLCQDCGKHYPYHSGTPKCPHCGSGFYFIPIHEKTDV